MPLPPGSSSFPPSLPATLRRRVWVDVPWADDDPRGDGSDRWGPYGASIIPIAGGQQVQREGDTTFATDRVYLPPDANVSSTCVITDLLTNKGYEAVFIQRWPNTIEVLLTRNAPDLR